MMKLTRRDWLALTMGAGATLTFDPCVLLAQGKMNTKAIPSRGAHLPVVDGERVLGIVSIRDLYRSIKEQMDADLLLLAETLIQG